MPAFRVPAVTFVLSLLFLGFFLPFSLFAAEDVCSAESKAAKGTVTNDCVACIDVVENGVKVEKQVGASCVVTGGGAATKAACTENAAIPPRTCKTTYCFNNNCFNATVDSKPTLTSAPKTLSELQKFHENFLLGGSQVSDISTGVTGITDNLLFDQTPLEQQQPFGSPQKVDTDTLTDGMPTTAPVPEQLKAQELDSNLWDKQTLSPEPSQGFTPQEKPLEEYGASAKDTFAQTPGKSEDCSGLWGCTKEWASDTWEKTKEVSSELFGWPPKESEARSAPEGQPVDALTTGYAPGAGCNTPAGCSRMQGAFETSRPNREGGYIPKTLDDVRLGRSEYVTLASDPRNYGKYMDMGTVTYTSPVDGKVYTLENVTGYVHDTGSAFRGRPDKFDVAVGDFRAWTDRDAMRFVSNQEYFGSVTHTWQQTSGLSVSEPTIFAGNQVVGTFEPPVTPPPSPLFTAETAPASWRQAESILAIDYSYDYGREVDFTRLALSSPQVPSTSFDDFREIDTVIQSQTPLPALTSFDDFRDIDTAIQSQPTVQRPSSFDEAGFEQTLPPPLPPSVALDDYGNPLDITSVRDDIARAAAEEQAARDVATRVANAEQPKQSFWQSAWQEYTPQSVKDTTGKVYDWLTNSPIIGGAVSGGPLSVDGPNVSEITYPSEAVELPSRTTQEIFGDSNLRGTQDLASLNTVQEIFGDSNLRATQDELPTYMLGDDGKPLLDSEGKPIFSGDIDTLRTSVQQDIAKATADEKAAQEIAARVENPQPAPEGFFTKASQQFDSFQKWSSEKLYEWTGGLLGTPPSLSLEAQEQPASMFAPENLTNAALQEQYERMNQWVQANPELTTSEDIGRILEYKAELDQRGIQQADSVPPYDPKKDLGFAYNPVGTETNPWQLWRENLPTVAERRELYSQLADQGLVPSVERYTGTLKQNMDLMQGLKAWEQQLVTPTESAPKSPASSVDPQQPTQPTQTPAKEVTETTAPESTKAVVQPASPAAPVRTALTGLESAVGVLSNKYKSGGVFTSQELREAVAQAQSALNAGQKIPDLYQQAKMQDFGRFISYAQSYLVTGDMERATRDLGPLGPRIIQNIRTVRAGFR